MKNRSRWALGGVLGITGVLVIVLLALWLIPDKEAFPEGTLRVPQDVASLQEALDRVAPGGTIAIHNSAEAIQGPIVIDIPDISVVTTGGDVVVFGSAADPAITIRTSGVVLRGLTIVAEGVGVLVTSSDCLLESVHVETSSIGLQFDGATRCQMQSVYVQGGRIGVEFADVGSSVASDLTVMGASEVGIRLRGSWSNTFSDLALAGNSIGISIEATSTDNVIDRARIQLSSITGIEIRASNDNRVSGITMDSIRVGVLLDGVAGTRLQGCTFSSPSVSGIFLQQALQNQILDNTVTGSQGTGIQLTQSPKNTLSENVVSDCAAAGISLIGSDRNLLFGNEATSCLVGIQAERSADLRVLRNRVSESDLCGIVLSQGLDCRLLDNSSIDDVFGMVVSESEGSTLLRNVIRASERAGLLLVSTTGENLISDNRMVGCAWGLLLAGSMYDLVTYNHLERNDVGAMLAQLGSGTRIEGNVFLDNTIGLQHQADVGASDELEILAISFPQGFAGASPVLTNNVFAGNREYDIRNDAVVSLLAAGNWWGDARARDTASAVISDGVALDQSAWRGVVAIGAGSDDVRLLLGRILQLVLTGEGFRVIDLVGMEPSQRVQQALIDSDVDLAWWSDAESLSGPAIERASASILPSSAFEGWSVIVSMQLANQLAEPSISALADWIGQSGEKLRYTATSALDEASFDELLAAYELDDAVHSITRADAISEVEALLKFGAVDVAIVRSLEETLTLSGFLAIEDNLRVLPRDPIQLIVQGTLAEEHPQIQQTLIALADRLTSDVLHDLVSRVRSLRKDPEDVAREFLQ